ncbi:MAG: hypothetical protein FWF79_01565 [Defluviitaleaceae bacterium]|nr:hypothetical protein [Defluviitaleaceae bacterium]
MLELRKKVHYEIIETDEPAMKLRNFDWNSDAGNTATLTWDWPQNRIIKLMFVFEWKREDLDIPDIEILLRDGWPHEVVTRDLSSKFSANIAEGKKKFLICPAYFNEDKSISVLKPAHTTDWIFKKAAVTAKVMYKPFPLSQYQQVNLRVVSSDPSMNKMITEALSYAVYERGRRIAGYPVDAMIMSGACRFYIKKEQEVKFSLEDEYLHLLDLKRG